MLQPPHPISETHDLSRFRCGKPELDGWLRERALANHARGDARTTVVTDAGAGGLRVVGFYALSPGSVVRASLSAALRKNAPEPMPVIVLARLGVDLAYQGGGIGRHLLLDAFRRAEHGASIIGGRALMANAKDAKAAAFYQRWKFRSMPGDPLLMLIPMSVVRASLAAADPLLA